MAYPGLAHEEHKYLGKDYCTGYTDIYGKWNTGFYCPQSGSKTAVFCCGTAVFKYCCTNQEPVDLSSGASGGGVLLDGDDPNFDHPHGSGVSSAVFVRVPIVFGVVCGIAAVLILLIVAACYFCSCCFAYKKRRNEMISDPHLQLHLNHQLPPQHGLYRNNGVGNSAVSSNLLNLYSPGTTAPLTSSLVTTPLDLDWASSIASYQSQQQLYTPPQLFPPGSSPAAAAIAAALSQRNAATGSLLYGTPTPTVTSNGTPSVISGSLASTTTSRLPVSVSQAYQGFLNSSTSTLSSVVPPAPPTISRGQLPQPPTSSLHRGNLPQQISTTASIVNSYLASLQQSQLQTHQPPEQQQMQPLPPPPVERTRQPSPPPSYFQSVSSGSSSYQGSRNSNRAPPSNNRTCRMATIQSILGGNGGTTPGGNYSSFNWNNEDDLLLADFLLRHENTLRRSLGLSNNPPPTNNARNTSNNNRGRGNHMLSQRELIELLLRLTGSGTSAPSARSESRAGSDSNSTASSVVTTRSTTSSLSSAGKLPANSSVNSNHKSVTISEVDEDNDSGQEVGSTLTNTVSCPGEGNVKASLDLALSRISVENDSGVPSSTCSTAGSEGAECLIGSIKMISRDISEEAIKLKKQHALDDDSSCVGGCGATREDGGVAKRYQQQLAGVGIHSEGNCASSGNGTTDGVIESSLCSAVVGTANHSNNGGEETNVIFSATSTSPASCETQKTASAHV